MTVKHRIRADQLQVGAPLPIDVYDAENRLLLRRGNVIATESQLERLIAHGLFSDEPLPSRPRAAGEAGGGQVAGEADDALIDGPVARPAPKPTTRVSVYADVVAAARTLETLLYRPAANPGFAADIGELADTLRKACTPDPDAAIAHTLFAREVRYPIRHSINAAVVTALLLSRMNNDSARTQAAVCAALTMNLSVLAVQDVLYRQQNMTDEQRDAVTAHPLASAQKLAALDVADSVWLGPVEQHHEFIDGSG